MEIMHFMTSSHKVLREHVKTTKPIAKVHDSRRCASPYLHSTQGGLLSPFELNSLPGRYERHGQLIRPCTTVPGRRSLTYTVHTQREMGFVGIDLAVHL